MPIDSEGELPRVFWWNPGIIADPAPEWWLREIEAGSQREFMAIRLETTQKILQAQAEGLAAAVKLLRQ
jgi:hypothetical protein